MPGTASRSRVATRTALPDDLPAVVSLVRQDRAEAHAEGVLTGRLPGAAAAGGFARLLADPAHCVVLAVLPGPDGDLPVGLAVLGVDQLSVLLGVPQVTVDNLVVHREHRRIGVGTALLSAAAHFAADVGADHVVVTAGGHEPERLRFLGRMGFAPLSTRRIVPRETLVRALAAWQRSRRAIPVPRRVPSLGRRS